MQRSGQGRPKGSLNKITTLAKEKADALGIDPFEVLLRFSMGDWQTLGYASEVYVKKDGKDGTTYEFVIEPSVRAAAAANACRYLYPTHGSIQLGINADLAKQAEEFQELPVEEQIKLMKDKIKVLEGTIE